MLHLEEYGNTFSLTGSALTHSIISCSVPHAEGWDESPLCDNRQTPEQEGTVRAGISSNRLMSGYEDNLTFSRFYLRLRFILGLCNFNSPQLQSSAQVTGEGTIVQPQPGLLETMLCSHSEHRSERVAFSGV